MQLSPNAKPFAVQLYVEDMEAFQAFADPLFNAMRDDKTIHGAKVTAIGREDVFTQLEKLENRDENDGY